MNTRSVLSALLTSVCLAAGSPAADFTFERGVIVAHWLGNLAPNYRGQSNVAHTYAAAWFDDEDIAWIATHGFDHLQIRVDASEWMTQGALRADRLAPVDDVLERAGKHGLGVVLAYDADAADAADAVEDWRRVAGRFTSTGENLRFLLAESASSREVVAAIRRADPRRFVYLTAPSEPAAGRVDVWNATPAALARLDLGSFDERVGVAFGYWEPELFSYQHPSQPVHVPFPGMVPDMKDLPEFFGYHDQEFADAYRAAAVAASGTTLSAATIAADFSRLAEWARTQAPGRTLYLQEFGVGRGQDPGSSRRYIEAVASAARQHGIDFSIYDYESGRAIRDSRGRPTPVYEGLGIAPAPKVPSPMEAGMSFFVTSVGLGKGADLGGLDGADRHCQALATAAGVGERVWRAYLSTTEVDARDRIGSGPWVNARGVVVARDLDELHSDRNHIDRHTALTEAGASVEQHDMLTGSTAEGRLATVDGAPATCSDWTSSGDGAAMAGHHDRFLWPRGQRFPRWRSSWNAAHETLGCDAERLSQSSAEGRYYCFSDRLEEDGGRRLEEERGRPPAAPSFRRGVFIHHWLVMPLARVVGKSSLPHTYGARWFNSEDFRWLARHGFDHVQIPVELGLWLGPDGTLDEERLKPFEEALGWARSNGMGVVATFVRPPESAVSVPAIWGRLARRFAGVGEELRFLLPALPLRDESALGENDRRMREVLAAVRAEDPRRFLYVEPVRRNQHGMVADPDASFEHLDDLHLPIDERLGVSVVYSEPEAFTWQKGIAERDEKELRPTTFPGGDGLTVADIQADFARLERWMTGAGAGREVYLGHFGSRDLVDAASTRRYMRAVFLEAARVGIGWSVYNYDTASGIRDEKGDPNPLYEGLGLVPEQLERPDATVGATEPAVSFRKGVNVAHWLSHNVPESYEYAAAWFDEEDVAWIASQGFDHLRMRVASDQWIDSNGDIDEAKIAPFDDVVRWAREHRLGVVLTMFSLPGYHTAPAGEKQAPWPYRTDQEAFADAEYAWWQVARRYAGEGAGLRFEILHRPDAPDAAEVVRFHRAMLGAIRATNPERVVYLAGHDMQRESLADLPLAEFADPNLALAFEFFEPLGFTFQFDESKPLREFPGEGDFALTELDRKIDAVGKWSKANAAGREIYVAAFGVYARAGDASARAFLTAARTAFERNGLSWAVYDYQSGCAVRAEDGKPTRNLEALFPREVPPSDL